MAIICHIGDEVVVLCTWGEIEISDCAVVSERSYICTGSHNYTSPTFDTYAKKIVIEAEPWVASDVFVARGGYWKGSGGYAGPLCEQTGHEGMISRVSFLSRQIDRNLPPEPGFYPFEASPLRSPKFAHDRSGGRFQASLSVFGKESGCGAEADS